MDTTLVTDERSVLRVGLGFSKATVQLSAEEVIVKAPFHSVFFSSEHVSVYGQNRGHKAHTVFLMH